MAERKIGIHGWYVIALLSGMAFIWLPSEISKYRTEQIEIREAEAEEKRIAKLQQKYHVDTYMLVTDVAVGDAVFGDPVPMRVDREILRRFFGTYFVEVRSYPEYEIICTAGDSINYKPDSKLPDHLTLAWWANDADCSGEDLEPGEYQIITTWIIETDVEEVGNHRIVFESNPFSIRGVAPEIAQEAIQEQRTIKQQLEEIQQRLETLGD